MPSVPPSSSRSASGHAVDRQHRPKQPICPQQPSCLLGLRTLLRLRKRIEDPYLDQRVMADLRISCVYMDFDPDPSIRDPHALLELMSPQDMEALARRYRFSRLDDIESPDPVSRRVWTTMAITDRLFHLLTISPSSTDVTSPLLLRQTMWQERGVSDLEDSVLRVFRDDIDRQWMVEFVLEPRDGTYPVPHAKCVMIEEAPLREDGLMLSELWIMLCLATSYFSRPEGRELDIMPVTVICCSGRDARVVQGWADAKHNLISVRKTRLIHLGEGEAPDKDPALMPKFLTLVRWLLAEPIPGRPAPS